MLKPPRSTEGTGTRERRTDTADNVVSVSFDNTFDTYEIAENPNGSLRWDLISSIDLAPFIPEGDALFDGAPDYDGTIWFTSIGGVVGYIESSTGDVFTTLLAGEKGENGIAIGEDGIFVLTSVALYRFEIDPATQAPVATWRETYEVDPIGKPGSPSNGSGSTPTLIGRYLITISDNATGRVNLLVFDRSRDFVGNRLLFFTKGGDVGGITAFGDVVLVSREDGSLAAVPFKLPAVTAPIVINKQFSSASCCVVCSSNTSLWLIVQSLTWRPGIRGKLSLTRL